MNTVTDVADITRIRREADAREVALVTYDRLFLLLEDLDREEWERPTECEPWTVADMVGHMIGAAKAAISFRDMVRQQVHGLRRKGEFDGNAMDAFNDLQVRDHAHLSPEERLAELRRLAPAAVRGRMRLPGLVRRVTVPLDTGGSVPEGTPETLGLGHLMDAVYTRDEWLHRIDIARATDRAPDVDSDADRRIVEDVVAEWADRHGRPFTLRLSGPAGGSFRQGSGGETLDMDAVEFCRVLSGRAHGDGLLATRVLF